MAAIKPVMSVLVVVALIAALPELISTTVTMVTRADPNEYIQPVVDEMMEFLSDASSRLIVSEPGAGAGTDATGLSADEQAMMAHLEAVAAESEALTEKFYAALGTFVQEKGAIFFSMNALYLILSPALAVILTRALLGAVRRQEITLAGSLKTLRHAPKALLVELWVFLRVYAWMLPGIAAMLLSVLLVYVAPGMVMLSLLLLFAGMILSLVLGIRAGLHYGLASIVFADDTALSPNACVRISWEIMRRRKMELFCLKLSFIGWDLLISFASMMIMGMFGTVIGNTVSMMASLLLSIYVSAAQVCFFLAYSGKLSHEAQAADHGEDDPLN